MNETTINNSFSWERLGLVARFYYPCLRLPLMIYPAVSLVLGISNYWLTKSEIGLLFAGLLGLILSMMFYFFPLFFTRPSSPVVESMLPATAAERLTVFAGACLIVNPILTYLPYYMIDWIFGSSSEIMEMMDTVSKEMFGESYFLNLAQALPPLVTCMFVVFTKWKNRISSAIGFTILTIVALSIIAGVFGIILAVTELADKVDCMNNNSYEQGVVIGKFLANKMLPMIISLGTLSLIYTVLMISLLYRKLRRQQV